MPDFVDNTAGYSEVTGTADYLMTTTGTGLHLRLDQALTDGQQVAYYAIGTSNGADAFESGIGTWQSSGTKLVRGTVTNSTNGGTISWDAGTKTVYIVANSATLVNTADERLDSTGIDELDPGTDPDGTEIAHFLQDGDGVSITVQQIAGNPIRAQLGHGKTINKSFSNFTKLNKGFSVGDGSVGVAAGLEPFLCYASGAGSGCLNLQVFFNVTAMSLNTGTTTTGRVCLEHLEYPITYNPVTYDRDYRQNILTGVMPVAGNEATWQFGFNNVAPEIATLGTGLGVFFELKATDTNWQAAFISASAGAANYRRVDTGVAAVTGTYYVFRVHLRSHPTDSAERKADFYINGDLVASIRNVETGVAAIPTGTKLSMVAVAQKTAGTTGSSCIVTEHYSEIERPALLTGLDV